MKGLEFSRTIILNAVPMLINILFKSNRHYKMEIQNGWLRSKKMNGKLRTHLLPRNEIKIHEYLIEYRFKMKWN